MCFKFLLDFQFFNKNLYTKCTLKFKVKTFFVLHQLLYLIMKRFCTLVVTITDLLLHRLFNNVTSKNKIAGVFFLYLGPVWLLAVWLSRIRLSRRRLPTSIKAVFVLFFFK